MAQSGLSKGYKVIFIFVAVLLALIVFLGMILIPSLYVNGMFLWAHPLKTAEAGQIRVACVGDSITYGHGVKNWTENAYPFQLGEMLGDEYCVNNYGYSDRTLLDEGNKPYRSEKLYQKSLEFNPDIVIIMLGTNDTKDGNWIDQATYERELTELVQSYRYLDSDPDIYLMCPPWTIDKANLRNTYVKNEINQGVKNVANNLGLTVIDLYPVFGGDDAKSSGLYYIDYIHPNDKGAKLIAQTIYNELI